MEQNKLTSQQICIENHEGMFLVVAGPGVGKTYTVVKRIQAMAQKGIEPEKILCLTFSDTAAREMKARVGESYDVNVFTYHSFCLEVMEEFKEEFNFINPKIITDSHKRTLINECIDEIDPIAYNNEKNNPYNYAGEIIAGIEEIKKNRIKNREAFFYNLENNAMWYPHLKELQTLQEEKPTKTREREIKTLEAKIEKMKELWQFYELYNSKMRELNYIDFFDMINSVLDKFESPNSALLEQVAQKYTHLIVDEYQDTNASQNEIIFELAKYIKNVFVVGDDDQIIYSFQGAKLDSVEKFLLKFKENINVLCFDKNYRSTQNILDVAYCFANLQDTSFCEYMLNKSNLSAKEKKDYQTTPPPKLRFISKCSIKDEKGNLLSKKLSAANPEIQAQNKPVEFLEFLSSEDERDYIIQKIAAIKEDFEKYNNKHKDEADFKEKKLSQIAILTRTNKELKDFAVHLKSNGIASEFTGGSNIFEINSVNAFIAYLQFLTNPQKYSDKLLSYLLLRPYHINPVDYKKLCELKNHHETLLDNIKSMVDEAQEKEKLTNFLETYSYLQNYINSEFYKNALLEIGAKTGIFEYYFNQNDINKLENIKGIKKLLSEADSYFDIHKNQGSFKLFVDYLTKLSSGEVDIRLDKEDEPQDAVQLSTYHSSKGREFEYVFMPYLTKGRWESSPSSYGGTIPETPIENESYSDMVEKNNQAKFLDCIKLLYVGMTRAKHSLSLSYTKSDDKIHGKLSWFIEKLISDESLSEIISKKLNIAQTFGYSAPKYDHDYRGEFLDFVKSKIPDKFSISALNAYRNCPKQYFYRYIMDIKSQPASKDDASFGSAMHSAFEYAIKEVMDNKKYPTNTEAYDVFCAALKTLEAQYPKNLLKSAKEQIFSSGKYYDKFISIAKEELISPDKKYEKNPHLDGATTGYYELYAEYPLKYEMDFEGRKITLNGFIDRLDKNQDGTYSIYDYKSKVHCDYISPADNYFYQMTFYKYVFEHQNPDCKIAKTAFLLPLEADLKHKFNLYDRFCTCPKGSDKTYFELKMDELLDCIRNIQNLNFDKPKKPNCTYCPYKQFCSSKTI